MRAYVETWRQQEELRRRGEDEQAIELGGEGDLSTMTGLVTQIGAEVDAEIARELLGR